MHWDRLEVTRHIVRILYDKATLMREFWDRSKRKRERIEVWITRSDFYCRMPAADTLSWRASLITTVEEPLPYPFMLYA